MERPSAYPDLKLGEPWETGGADDNDGGWLLGFADMVTLLLTLFVLLLAFGHFAPQRQADPPAIAIPEDIGEQVEMVTRAGEVDLAIKDELLFAEGSARLSEGGGLLLARLAQVFVANDYGISVQGHTDDLPIHTAQFPSNWELSTARASTVTRYFIEHGIAAARLSAVGYADTRPLTANDSPAARARNRRVSLVLHLPSPSAP